VRLRWSNQQIKGFSSPVKKAEKVNEWGWLIVVIASIGAIVWMWVKIFTLYQIHIWLKTF